MLVKSFINMLCLSTMVFINSASAIEVGLVQFPIQNNITEDAFLGKVEKWISDAKAKGVELLVFPELITLDLIHYGNVEDEKKQLLKIATDFTPRYIDWLKLQSKKNNMIILGGTTPRLQSDQTKKIVNSAIIVFPEGTVRFQDKLFLTPDEQNWGWTTGKEINVFQHSKLGKFVINTCYDSEFPKISNELTAENPELFLIPSMTGINGLARVRWTSQARSIEHYAYVLVTGTVSSKSTKDKVDTGQALIIQPKDDGFKDVVEGPYNKAALVVDTLNLDLLRQKRKAAGIFPVRDSNKRKEIISVVTEGL